MTFKAIRPGVLVFENVVSPGQGPPRHLHRDTDEAWYIVEGSMRFRLADEIHPAGPGSYVVVPRMTPHCFQNIGAAPATILVTFAPPVQMESFFRSLAAEPRPDDLFSDEGFWDRHGMQLLGSPLSKSHPE